MILTKHQKFMLFSLVIFTLTAVLFGLNQLYGGLYGRDQLGDNVKSISGAAKEEQLRAVTEMLALHSADSDGDLLSDYDEFYLYKTSAYLKDTDGDGIDDQEELEQGNDPTCHKDKECGNGEVKPVLPLYQGVDVPQFPISGPPAELPDQSTMTPEDLRALLEQSGFPKDQLNRLSDTELMETWSAVFDATKA